MCDSWQVVDDLHGHPCQTRRALSAVRRRPAVASAPNVYASPASHAALHTETRNTNNPHCAVQNTSPRLTSTQNRQPRSAIHLDRAQSRHGRRRLDQPWWPRPTTGRAPPCPQFPCPGPAGTHGSREPAQPAPQGRAASLRRRGPGRTSHGHHAIHRNQRLGQPTAGPAGLRRSRQEAAAIQPTPSQGSP
jgi:hypothetical protein